MLPDGQESFTEALLHNFFSLEYSLKFSTSSCFRDALVDSQEEGGGGVWNFYGAGIFFLIFFK